MIAVCASIAAKTGVWMLMLWNVLLMIVMMMMLMVIWVMIFSVNWCGWYCHFHCYWLFMNDWEWNFLLVNNWSININVLRIRNWLFNDVWNLLFVNNRCWNRDFHGIMDLLFDMNWVWPINRNMTIKNNHENLIGNCGVKLNLHWNIDVFFNNIRNLLFVINWIRWRHIYLIRTIDWNCIFFIVFYPCCFFKILITSNFIGHFANNFIRSRDIYIFFNFMENFFFMNNWNWHMFFCVKIIIKIVKWIDYWIEKIFYLWYGELYG